jgi:hypothetical protein
MSRAAVQTIGRATATRFWLALLALVVSACTVPGTATSREIPSSSGAEIPPHTAVGAGGYLIVYATAHAVYQYENGVSTKVVLPPSNRGRILGGLGFAWASDGRTYAFNPPDTSGNSTIAIKPVHGPVKLRNCACGGTAFTTTEFTTYRASTPSTSPNSFIDIYTAGGGHRQLVFKNQLNPLNDLLAGSPAQWQLIFQDVSSTGENAPLSGIYAMDIKGQVKFLADATWLGKTIVSPDGSHIAYQGWVNGKDQCVQGDSISEYSFATAAATTLDSPTGGPFIVGALAFAPDNSLYTVAAAGNRKCRDGLNLPNRSLQPRLYQFHDGGWHDAGISAVAAAIGPGGVITYVAGRGDIDRLSPAKRVTGILYLRQSDGSTKRIASDVLDVSISPTSGTPNG